MIQMNHCFMADVFRCLRCIHCVCQEVAVDSSLVRELCDCCLPSAAFTVSSDQLQSCCLSRTVDTSRANKVPCGVFPESSARNRKHHHNLSNLRQEKKKKSSFSRCRSTSRHLGLICFLDKVDVYFKASRGVRLTGKQRCEDRSLIQFGLTAVNATWLLLAFVFPCDTFSLSPMKMNESYLPLN